MFAAVRTGTADLGIDLGSDFARAVVRGRGLVAEMPTMVAIEDTPAGRQASAVGTDAKQRQGRTSASSRVVQPVRGGVIADFEATEHLLRALMAHAPSRSVRGVRVLVSVPFDASEVERRALQESTRAAGGREVHLVSALVAAALGAELPVFEPTGSMVVLVGGGRTEVGVLSLGGLVTHRTSLEAGDAMDTRLVQWLRRQHGLMIGERTAERVKVEVGAARTPGRPRRTRIAARDLATGAPATLDLDGSHVAEAVSPTVSAIRDAVVAVLSETPPELCADILASGVLLVGGGSLLEGLDRVLADATGLPFVHADDPTRAVARGLARLLDEPSAWAQVVRES